MTSQDTDSPEKANLQNYHNAMWRLAYVGVLLLASLLGVAMVAALVGGQAYGSLVGLLYVATYILLAPALVLLIMGKVVPRAMQLVARGLVGLMLIVLAFVLVGNIQDILGVVCRGFEGDTISCVDSQLFLVTILLFSPYVFLAMMIAALLGLTKGWRDYLKAKQAK